MERLLWICVAGAAGTGTRYLVGLWAAQRFGTAFPYGTLFVNVGGCFLIAVVMHTAATFAWSPTLRSAVTIGYLGGLTTYSSFNYESSRLAQDGAPDLAAMNAAMTWLGCFVAGWLGVLTARHVHRSPNRERAGIADQEKKKRAGNAPSPSLTLSLSMITRE